MPTLAVRLGRIRRRSRLAPHEVLATGDRFQVRRIDAGATTAEVVDLESVGNRADEILVGETMSRVELASDGEIAVARAPSPCRPLPALVSTTLLEASQEPFQVGTLQLRGTPQSAHAERLAAPI